MTHKPIVVSWFLAMLTLGALSVVATPNLYAVCAASVPVFHGLDSYFQCADATPVAGLAYQISDPVAISTGTEDIVCEAVNGSSCATGGVVGDNVATIATDWGNAGTLGCPILGGIPHRIVIVVQASDGRGLVASISGSNPDLGYLVEAAHPIDAASNVHPLACNAESGAPTVLGQAGGQLSLHFTRPIVYSDC